MELTYSCTKMHWLAAGTFLLLLAIFLRWVLKLNAPGSSSRGRVAQLGSEREAIYQPVAQEIVTQSAILGISLNDAIEERDAGQPDIAWRLVYLSLSEWDRLAEILSELNSIMVRHLASTRGIAAPRTVIADRFRSRAMIDFMRMHELFDQLVFRTRLRYQLHLRMLRRASETLTSEFRKQYRNASRAEDRSAELWESLDYYFHDFDLLAKESLLSFRLLLACLPHPQLDDLMKEAQALVRHSVRVKVSADR
jgi:hypothetical protein